MCLVNLLLITVSANFITPGSTAQPDQELTSQLNLDKTGARNLSILLASLSFTGHVIPALALGEELVRRGHQVTLCTTELEGKDLAKSKTEEVGIKLISAGKCSLSYSEYLEIKDKGDLRNFTGVFSLMKKALPFFPDESNRIGKAIDGLNVSKFDMIISTEFLSHMTACLSKKWRVPGMILGTRLQFEPHHIPPWVLPPLKSTLKLGTPQTSDNLTFLQRFSTVLLSLVVQGYWSILGCAILRKMEFANSEMCSIHYAALYPGVYAPQIVPTVIGFEYPRTISPLTHYVGPILSKKRQPIPLEMLTWLNSKHKDSVLFISTGSTAKLYSEHALAIVSAIKATGMSALWSLRESNQYILKGLDFDTEQLRIYKWTPQVSVLNHTSVGMALLHGGSNGVHEALYHAVPVIVVPSTNDQEDVAARLDHSKAGVQILKNYLSNETLIAAIKSIQSSNYISFTSEMACLVSDVGWWS